jgi:glucose-6-phosphate-specific signal transduction histidine kinase
MGADKQAARAQEQENWPWLFLVVILGSLARTVSESLPWVCPDLTQLSPQAQTHGSELVHPKTYIIWKWLEHMKGPFLANLKLQNLHDINPK